MSWLDNEMKKLREQEEQRRRLEQMRKAQEEQARKAEKTLLTQRQQTLDQIGYQKLDPIITSLQIRQLVRDANRKLRGTISESISTDGNVSELNKPLVLLRAHFHIGIYKEVVLTHTTSSREIYQRSYTYKQPRNLVSITITYEDQPLPVAKISSYEPEEVITSSNHRSITERLKREIAKIAFQWS